MTGKSTSSPNLIYVDRRFFLEFRRALDPHRVLEQKRRLHRALGLPAPNIEGSAWWQVRPVSPAPRNPYWRSS